MIIRKPAYYDSFRCLAAACPDSCCKQWDVLVDPASAAAYSAAEGPLGADLRRYLQQEPHGEYYFQIVEGRCPFWQQDGLCRIQSQLGHDALCKTCREFPRLTHDYGDFVELQLELSCPEAARMLLNAPAAPWIEQEVPGGEEPDYDPGDMALLLQTRQEMLRLLARKDRPVAQTLALALLYGSWAQAALDGAEQDPFDPEAELEFAAGWAQVSDCDLPRFYSGLNILTEQWHNRLAAPAQGFCREPRLRQLARYGVERYWLQAISDFDLMSRVKLVIAGCLLVARLGGDFVETAQLYAKEIENDADNIDALLDGAYTQPVLSDRNLLGLLLKEEAYA